MKKKTNNEETIKEKILSRLLEGPKTQTQLLTDLEYETNQHGNISKSLKTLRSQGFIVEKLVKSEKLDDYCKLWSIVPNSQILKIC